MRRCSRCVRAWGALVGLWALAALVLLSARGWPQGEAGLEATPEPPPPWSADAAARVALINKLHAEHVEGEEGAGEEGAPFIATTLSARLGSVEEDVLPWVAYHVEVGFRAVFILWDGDDEAAEALLRACAPVTLLPLAGPRAPPAVVARFARYHSNHWQWGKRPGNYQLMVKQGFCVNEAIRWARRRGDLEHVFHLDVDELFLPLSTGEFTVQNAIRHSPPGDSLRFMNYEAVPERLDVRGRGLRECTLFKVHGAHVEKSTYARFVNSLKDQPTDQIFLVYGNGKACGRVSNPFLRSWGPHFMKGGRVNPLAGRFAETKREDDDDFREVQSDAGAILHFAYPSVDAMRRKASGSSCPHVDAARRGEREVVNQCFVMGFDAEVFVSSAQGDDAGLERLFRRRVTVSPEKVDAQLRTGLLRRIHAPSVMMEQHERMARWLAAGSAGAAPPARAAAAPAEEWGDDTAADYLLYHV